MVSFRNLRKKTIGFWAGDQNNFQFLDPLIKELSKNYKTKKFTYENNVQELEKDLSSVDVGWFEWGNGPIVPASNSEINTPIINRIHRYELYSDSPRHVKWSNVDKLIFSSRSMIKRFEEKFPNENKIANPELIEIGVDTNLFTFKDKKITKDLIYVGRIHPHKNPSLLLQIFAKLLTYDSDYRLKIIGGFSDELYEEFFMDQITKLKLENNLEFLGKLSQAEMVEHLQQADFFLISSIIEGLSQASLEAMSCGVRPVIVNYYGSEKAYPKKYLYKTVDEAVKMIIEPVGTRKESLEFIQNRYRLEDKVENIADVIEGLLRK